MSGTGRRRSSVMRRAASNIDFDACDHIFNFLHDKHGKVTKGILCDELSSKGILNDDPRLSNSHEALEDHCDEEKIERNSFAFKIQTSVEVIESAFTNNNIITNFEKFSQNIQDIFETCKASDEDKLSGRIPQLSRQNPDHFGLSLCTVDGQRLEMGDSGVQFPVLGCTKPISYCMAVEENGAEVVHGHVGREPSGEKFNALMVNHSGLPHNPLIESGAIMISSLVRPELSPADRFDYVLNKWTDLAGGKTMGFNNSVYLSERVSNDRNCALGHFMRENNAFREGVDVAAVLEFYIQCSALTSDTNKLAIVAASLANGGVCPLTGVEVFSADTVKSCLTLMYSCGMYDYSGEFAFSIGLPSKSSPSGVIMVVIPNVMGICTYSPLLDKYGNSARGVDFFSKFTGQFNFHMFDSIENLDKEDPRQADAAEEITVEKIIKYSAMGDLTALKRIRSTAEELTQGDYDGRTPLHLAASNGHLSVVRYILDVVGIQHVNPRDRWNGTPYDDAVRENFDDVAGYLKSSGGTKGESLKQRYHHTIFDVIELEDSFH